MKPVLALIPLALLAGCSTTLSDRQVEAMHTPTLTLNCETGCSASYTDPRDRPALPTNGWDVGMRAISAAQGIATSVAPWAAIGLTAMEGIKGAVGDDNSVRTDTQDNSVRADNRDNSVRTDNRVDSTHEPTVVTQPAPTIVTQPEPIIVEQPRPIVMPEPISATE